MAFIVPEAKRLVNVGDRFGRLEVIGVPFWLPVGIKRVRREQHAVCRCDCGRVKTISSVSLRHRRTKSCGCAIGNRTVKHGESRTALYKRWACMKDRCGNTSSRKWRSYGGRGIRVCDEWASSYESFREWAVASGFRPELQLDRADNDGPYSPENCRWVTPRENMENMQRTMFITAFGETKTVHDWFRDDRCMAPSKYALRSRVWAGWSGEDSVSRKYP